MKHIIFAGSIASLALALSGNADAQLLNRGLSPQVICDRLLLQTNEETNGTSYRAPTGPWNATVSPTITQCREDWNIRPRATRVEVVNGRCTSGGGMLGGLRCRANAPASSTTTTVSATSYASSSSVRTLRGDMRALKELVATWIARQITTEGRVDAQGRRITSAEQALELYGVQIRNLADTLIALLASPQDQVQIESLMVRRTGEDNDIPASERVGQYLQGLGGNMRERLDTVFVQVIHGGTRVQPGASVSVVNVGEGTAITAGPSVDVQHRFGEDVRNAVGVNVNAGFGGTRGSMWMPSVTYSLLTEVYYARRVGDVTWLRVGAFHSLSGRMDECNSDVEPCAVTGHGGGALLGLGLSGEALGLVEIDTDVLIGGGFMRSRTLTGAFQRSDGFMIGGILRGTVRF